MGISGITNTNQYTAMQPVKTPVQNKTTTSAATVKTAVTIKSETQPTKPAAYNDVTGRLANVPNVEKYEAVIQRFLSGESELENPSSMKPLTDDQIALRQFMREYRSTDTRTLPQMQADMQKANNNFLNYWKSTGNTGPMPGRVISADGSFQILNSKAEKDEFMKKNTISLLENAMSVIKAGKNNANTSGSLNIQA